MDHNITQRLPILSKAALPYGIYVILFTAIAFAQYGIDKYLQPLIFNET